MTPVTFMSSFPSYLHFYQYNMYTISTPLSVQHVHNIATVLSEQETFHSNWSSESMSEHFTSHTTQTTHLHHSLHRQSISSRPPRYYKRPSIHKHTNANINPYRLIWDITLYTKQSINSRPPRYSNTQTLISKSNLPKHTLPNIL